MLQVNIADLFTQIRVDSNDLEICTIVEIRNWKACVKFAPCGFQMVKL